MSTVKANDLQTTTGGIPTVKGQKLIPTAWVNFNGTGTVAIRDSENVSSITDVGTGRYDVNFSTAMADANYAAVTTAGTTVNPSFSQLWTLQTASKVNVQASNYVGTYVDATTFAVAILGGQA